MDVAVFGEPRRRMIRLPDGDMAALDFGDERRPVDVVFLHANGFNAMTYRSILAPLAPSLRILAVDQRGHGASRLPADPQRLKTWQVYRDDLLALLDTLDGPPPILAGHSMGGAAALLAAGKRRGVAQALVLFDPVIMPRLMSLYGKAPWAFGHLLKKTPLASGAARRRNHFDSAEAAFAGWKGRGAFRTWPDIMLADYVAGGVTGLAEVRGDTLGDAVRLSCDPAWESASFASALNDTWGAASRARVPITIFKAERGSTCNIGNGEAFLKTSPGGSLFTVPGASHFLPMERPDVVRDALLDAAV